MAVCTTQTVHEPAKLSVADFVTSPSPTTPGETFTATVTVQNTGDESGTGTVIITVNGAEWYRFDVTVAANSSVDNSFDMSISTVGDHRICAEMA